MGGVKCLKLYKYTLKLYKYAVLRGLAFGGVWGVLHPDSCHFALLPPMNF